MKDHGCDMDSDSAQRVPSLRRALQMLRDWQQARQLRGEPAATPAASAAPVGATALPSGWQSTTDPATGQPYYWRTEDPAGTVTWERPG